MRPDDLLDRFQIDPAIANAAALPPEPRLIGQTGEREVAQIRAPSRRSEPASVDWLPNLSLVGRDTAFQHATPSSIKGEGFRMQAVPRNGLAGSLILHLLPLLFLLHWSIPPAEAPQPIPVRLVMEPPPPPPPTEKKPPPGRLASEDMGRPAPQPNNSPPQPAPAEPQIAAANPPAAAPEPSAKPPSAPALVSALPEPTPSPETQLAMTEPPPQLPRAPALALPPAPPTQRPTKQVVAARLPHPAPAPHAAKVPGPDATRDEYLAYCQALILRHGDLVPPAFLSGRSGVAILSILVLGDGTIARIAIERGSGYPDIDARIEQMVASVHRFPPLPMWMPDSRLALVYEQPFRNGSLVRR